MRFKQMLMLGVMLLASALRAEVADYFEGTVAGNDLPHATGVYTNWANMTPTVASSPIDLSTWAGMYLRLSGTVSNGVNVQFAEVSYTATAWSTQYRLGGNSYSFIRKHAPWMRVMSPGISTPWNVTPYVSARYMLISSTTTAASTIGNVGINSGTNFIGSVSLTGGTLADLASLYAHVTTTAGGTTPRGGTVTSYDVTSTVLVNITSVAGVDAPCEVCITSTGLGAGVYYGWRPDSTWVAPKSYYAATTTAVCKNMGRGMHLNLSATAAAATITVEVDIAPIR